MREVQRSPAHVNPAAERSPSLSIRLEPEQLQELAATVAELIRTDQPAEPSPLVDRAALARLLDCSPSTVDKMRRAKRIPCTLVGDCPKFVVADVLAALRTEPKP